MWPFRKRKRQSSPAGEAPNWGVDSAAALSAGYDMTGLDDRAQARSTISVTVTNWGQLGTHDVSVKGIAAVLGLFANTHPQCAHWWCNRPDQPFNLLAEMWYAPAAPDKGFLTDCITAEICPVRDVADDVSAASFNQPVHKMFIQCTTSDAVAVSLANLIQPPVSEFGELAMWRMDEANMERLLIKPREVAATDIPDVPMMPGELGAIFLLRRVDRLVHYDRMYRHEVFGREVFAEPPEPDEVISYEERAARRAAELAERQD